MDLRFRRFRRFRHDHEDKVEKDPYFLTLINM